MLEHIADFTAWPILTGICVGYVANRIMSGEGKGCCMNLIIGIIGSYVGTFISHLLNIELLGKYYGSELWKLDYAADEAGNLPPDLKRGVLSEDGLWNLLSDYRELQKTKQ